MTDSVSVNHYNSSEKQRILWIDVLRGIGILFVVLGHCQTPLLKFIYSFHMPLFFLLSGYLWKPSRVSFGKTLLKNLRSYILPYFILAAINLAKAPFYLYVLHEPFPFRKYIFGLLYSIGSIEWMPNCSPIWFLTALFVAITLFDLIYRCRAKALRAVLVVLCVAGSAALSYLEAPKLPWNADTALMGVGFLFLGHLLKEQGVLEKYSHWKLWLQFLVLGEILIAGILAFYYNPVSYVDFDNNRYGSVPCMVIAACAFSFLLFYFCYRIKWGSWRRNPVSGYLCYLGKHTIFILGFDYIMDWIAEHILNRLSMHIWPIEFLMRVILLSITCLIWSWIVSKIRTESIRKALSF